MAGIMGPVTGIRLDEVQVPMGRVEMAALSYAWRLALELHATAYAVDEDQWLDAGWTDGMSVRLVGEKRERRIQPIRGLRRITRRYLDKRVTGDAEPEKPEPEEVEKALVMAHAMPDGKQLIAIVLRGTGGTAREWEPNFACHATDGVHTGFLDLAHAFADAAESIALPQTGAAVEEPSLTLAQVQAELALPDSRFKLFLTGYSQGAAVMQLYARHLLDMGALPQNMVGLGFASPSVAYEMESRYERMPLYHLANADDLTPRVGARHHLGELWRYEPDDQERARWYGAAFHDPALAEFRALTDSLDNLEQGLRFCVHLMRAALGLSRNDLYAFFSALFHPLKETSTTRTAVAQAQLTARLLLFKVSGKYRAVFGQPVPDDDQELVILRRMLALHPSTYATLLWQALALPHALVHAPGEAPAAYQDIVLQGLNRLKRLDETA